METRLKLEYIQMLTSEASSGPWDVTHIYDGEEFIAGPQTDERIHHIATASWRADARFIVACRDVVPALVDIAKAARAYRYEQNKPDFSHADIEIAYSDLMDAVAKLD